MDISRRKLLTGTGALLAAPATVKASSLMPIVMRNHGYDPNAWADIDMFNETINGDKLLYKLFIDEKVEVGNGARVTDRGIFLPKGAGLSVITPEVVTWDRDALTIDWKARPIRARHKYHIEVDNEWHNVRPL